VNWTPGTQIAGQSSRSAPALVAIDRNPAPTPTQTAVPTQTPTSTSTPTVTRTPTRTPWPTAMYTATPNPALTPQVELPLVYQPW
jgi:hypothetical protein